MKRVLTFILALTMALSLAACGGRTDDNNKGKTDVDMTAQEILDTLKEKLGDSFECDITEDEDRMSGYWGLDMDKVESWAAMSNSNSSLNPSAAVVLKVKDGYAQDAAALLQRGYEQILSYSRMYNMDLRKVLQARLFVNGNYVALLILGAEGDWEAGDEEQAKFAAEEAAKVDAAWKEIFGSSENSIVIPADDGNSGFNMDDGPVSPDESKENNDAKEPENNAADQNGTKKPDNKADGSDNNASKNDTKKEQTAQEVLDSLKKSLGSSYTSDAAESEARMSGYYGLDMSKVESWAAESSSNASLNADCAVVLKVKDGYAKTAAAALQASFDQTVSYNRMYDMDLQRVLQGRLFVSGNYVALIIEGAKPDDSASTEEQARFAADEAAKVDSAWKALFGSAGNSIVIPTESESGSGFDMSDGLEG